MRPNTIFKKSITTTRDLKILEYIAENKLASRNQLNLVFFKNSKCTRVINKRLNKLMHMNLISRIGVQADSYFLYCYEITQNGINAIKGNLRLGIKKLPQKSEKPQHDLILVDLRNKLSSYREIVDYLTENTLQCFDVESFDPYLMELKEQNSDAGIQVKIANRIFWLALEFENTHQSVDKIERKITKIYNSSINAVVFVCKSSSILDSYQCIEKKIIETTTSSPKIFYQKLDVLLSAKESISFSNILNHSLTIR